MNQTIEHFQTAESRAQASLDSAEARKRSDKIQQLRAAIEAVEGERMKSPRDFEALHQHIFEKIHQSISTSTLKRVWGYMSGYSSVRPHTLDLLARYIDYRDFEHFCEQQGCIPAVEPASSLSTRQSGLLSGSCLPIVWSLHSSCLEAPIGLNGGFRRYEWRAKRHSCDAVTM